jgi:hypothetical protein
LKHSFWRWTLVHHFRHADPDRSSRRRFSWRREKREVVVRQRSWQSWTRVVVAMLQPLKWGDHEGPSAGWKDWTWSCNLMYWSLHLIGVRESS